VTKPSPDIQVVRDPHLRWVAIADMKVSPRAQREFSQAQAERYAADFDLEALGYPVLNCRDGVYYIVDGQHRIAALKLIGWGDQQVQCETYFDLTEAQEADLFLRRDERRAINAFDKFRIALVAGREPEVDIERTVLINGLTISNNRDDGCISAVTSLRKVYTAHGPVLLGRVLRIIRDAYDANRRAFDAPTLSGVALFCARYDGAIDEARVVDRLAKLPRGALGLSQKADVIRRQTGANKANAIAAAITETVNAGRGPKIPSWWKGQP
jgi:hypothetical protein